jgi:hypothetical protein
LNTNSRECELPIFAPSNDRLAAASTAATTSLPFPRQPVMAATMADSDDDLPPIDWLIDKMRLSEQEKDRDSVPPTRTPDETTITIDKSRPIDGTVTFESLPGELRNRVYDLAGCLRYWESEQPTAARTTLRGDAIAHHHTSKCVVSEPMTKFRPAYLMINGKESPKTACSN